MSFFRRSCSTGRALSAASLLAQSLLALTISVGSVSAQAPGQMPVQPPEMMYPTQTTMTIYPVVKGKDHKQFVVTRAGYQLPLPPPGISKRATELAVYRDPQGNFWYTDANGSPVKITTEQLQWKVGQLYGPQAAAQVPLYAAQNSTTYPSQPPVAQPAPVQQTTIYQSQPGSSGSGSSALATGLAAGAGGMVGGMMGGMIGGAIAGDNHYYGGYGVPYGVPLYRGVDSRAYYYNHQGNRVFVNNDPHTVNVTKNWNADRSWQDSWNEYHNNHPSAQPRTIDGAGAKPYSGADNFFRNRSTGGFGNRFGRRR